MMVCNGGLVLLQSPGQSIGFPEKETEKLVKDLETTLSYSRRSVVSQGYGSNYDKFRAELGSKPAEFGTTPVRNKSLGSEKISFKASTLSSKERKDGACKFTKGEHNLGSASTKEFQPPWGSRAELAEQFSSGRPLFATQESNDEDWRSLSSAFGTGQKVSAISNHDLMRIAELRFSTDMEEGDGGSQVVLLQKALFWLGYLSRQSDITGYFGTETKQALREFQEAHGVNQTGVWGGLSKQALWHTISAEILHRVVDEKANKPADALNCGMSGKAAVLRQVWQSWTPVKLAAAVPEGEWRLLSGIALLLVGILFGLFISKVSAHKGKGASVKRRIVRSTEPAKSIFPLKNEEQLTNDIFSVNGAASLNKMSQMHSKSSITEAEGVGQAGAVRVLHNKEVPDLMYSSLGHGVQHNTGRKTVSDLGIPSRRLSSSKPGTDSVKRGKQPGSWTKPTKEAEKFSRISENGRPEPLSPSRLETSRFQREGGEPPADDPLSRPKTNLAKQNDESIRPKKLDYEAVNVHGEDEPNVRKRIEELRKAVEAAEQNGEAAVHALAEERNKSLELEEKISRQRESAASLEEEVRGLKESHDALLESLRKKIGPATWGASLLYQNFRRNGNGEAG